MRDAWELEELNLSPSASHYSSATDLQSAVRNSSPSHHLSTAAGGIRTHTVEILILVPPANWATAADLQFIHMAEEGFEPPTSRS